MLEPGTSVPFPAHQSAAFLKKQGSPDKLCERKVALTAQLQEPEEQPITLHLGLAEVYRRKVAELTTALNVEGTKTEAAELLRGLLSGIRLIPEGSGLAIELTEDLAGIMTLSEARNDKTRASGAGSGRITLVAGAGFEPAAFRL